VLFVHDGPMYVDQYGDVFGIHMNNSLVSRYKRLGEEVTFLMRSQRIERAEGFSRITSEGFTFISIPNFKSIRNYYKKAEARKIIHRALNEHDILVARMPSAAGKIAIEYAKKIGRPYMVEFVACTFDAYWNYGWKGKLIAHFKLWQQRKIIKDVTDIIYVTKHFLQNRYPSAGNQISCSNVEIGEMNEDTLLRRISKISNLNDTSRLVLGTVASLDVPYKGQADVITAIGKLKKKGMFYQYKIVGQGDCTYLQKAIAKHDVEDLVEIIGPLHHEDVFAFYGKIDVYIQPSKQEGLPRALIEAMSMACPAIGTDVAGIPELISASWIYPRGSISRLMQLIESLNVERMLEAAKYNFEQAKDYQKPCLEERRQVFYENFLEHYGFKMEYLRKDEARI
jgi:glycosyltransferase involved in cell wall biosynthesis